MEPWLLGCSSMAHPPSQATQLHLMVCSFSGVQPSAKFMWQHQQKEEKSKDIKDRARLIYISPNTTSPPPPEERAKNKNIKEWDGKERVENGKQLGYNSESVKGFLKVRLNVLNYPFSGSSASSLPHWVAVLSSHLSRGYGDQPQARMLLYRGRANVPPNQI